MDSITLIHPSDERVREELALRAKTIISEEDDDVCLRLIASNITKIAIYERYAPISRRMFTLTQINHSVIGIFVMQTYRANHKTIHDTLDIIIFNGQHEYHIPDKYEQSIKSQLIIVCANYALVYELNHDSIHTCYCGHEFGLISSVINTYYCANCHTRSSCNILYVKYIPKRLINRIELQNNDYRVNDNLFVINNTMYLNCMLCYGHNNHHAIRMIAQNHKPGMRVIMDQQIVEYYSDSDRDSDSDSDY